MLLGNADNIVQYLAHRLDWDISQPRESLSISRNIRKRSSDSLLDAGLPRQIGNSYVYFFFAIRYFRSENLCVLDIYGCSKEQKEVNLSMN